MFGLGIVIFWVGHDPAQHPDIASHLIGDAAVLLPVELLVVIVAARIDVGALQVRHFVTVMRIGEGVQLHGHVVGEEQVGEGEAS